MERPERQAVQTCVRSRGRGLTLIESVVAMIVVAIMLVAALQCAGAVARSRAAQRQMHAGRHLAQDLMTEVLQSRYEEPVDVPVFGRETGEATDDRSAWDDVDDYHGLVDAPPRHKDTTPLAGFDGWERAVHVSTLHESTLAPLAAGSPDSGVRHVEVAVTSPAGVTTRLTAVRTNVTSLVQQPTLDSIFVSHVGIDLQLSSDGAVGISGGADVLNHRLPPSVDSGGAP